MLDQQISDLGSIVDAMENGGGAPDSDSLDNLARTLAKLFGVDKDEVAVLKVLPKYKSLKFVLPEKLTPVGTIPLTSTTALAARTARDRKPELVNNFSSSRHANVFEAVPLGRDPNELIQKIMSAPSWTGRVFMASCKSPGRLGPWPWREPISRKKICARWCRYRPCWTVF